MQVPGPLRSLPAWAQEKLQSLSADFDSRLQLAAFNARCSAEQAHQQQLAQRRQQGGGMLAECQALRERLAGLEAEHSQRVEEALAAQRAALEDGALRTEQAHSQAVAALHVRMGVGWCECHCLEGLGTRTSQIAWGSLQREVE